MYYILFYKTAEDYLERRKAFREQHLSYINEYNKRGEVILAGALANPPDQAIIIFKCDSSSIPENFAMNDPYVLNGVVVEWKLREWAVVIGG